MKFPKLIEPYLNYTKKECKGISVLIVLLILVILFRLVYPYIKQSEPALVKISYVILKEKEEAKEFEQKSNASLKRSRNNVEIIKVPFDPNNATYQELIQVGFSGKIANTIINYREKGGRFRENNDLFQIYGLDSTYAELVNDYCRIKRETAKIEEISKTVASAKIVVELNSADTSRLKELKGIGPVLSSRIIKYRTLLGGFCNTAQLTEVYGIDGPRFDLFSANVVVDTSRIKKINLNTAAEKELHKHPYINKFQARGIVKFRETAGGFTSKKQLLDNYIFTKEGYQKLDPYIKID